MRLLHASKPRFGEFSDSHIPAYAILSHRWGDSEVSYQELQQALSPETKLDELLGRRTPSLDDKKYEKIQACRAKAAKQNFKWIWVDTCCINKDSSAELSEAINSMYRWYERAAVCFVYMSDVHRRRAKGQQEGWDKSDLGNFLESKWFQRGWTLQELLAPRDRVLFYDTNWEYIGDRESLAELISRRTRIDVEYLRHDSQRPSSVATASVAKRMSWASGRDTSRPEDMAYCLLGLFDVNMPLLYGEGRKAFMRLQLEIIKKDDDESIFAWRRSARHFSAWEKQQVTKVDLQLASSVRKQLEADLQAGPSSHLANDGIPMSGIDLPSGVLHSGLLAQEPRDFANSSHIKPYPLNMRLWRSTRLPYSMTNRGLLFYVAAYPSHLAQLKSQGDLLDVPLNCYVATSDESLSCSEPIPFLPVAITLRKEVAGEDQHWRRHDCRSFQATYKEIIVPGEVKVQTAFYIRQDGL